MPIHSFSVCPLLYPSSKSVTTQVCVGMQPKNVYTDAHVDEMIASKACNISFNTL